MSAKRSLRLPAIGATIVALGVLAAFLSATRAAADAPVVTYGASDAQSVAVLSGLPGYKNAFGGITQTSP